MPSLRDQMDLPSHTQRQSRIAASRSAQADALPCDPSIEGAWSGHFDALRFFACQTRVKYGTEMVSRSRSMRSIRSTIDRNFSPAWR
jgi:hypothetical protein